MLGLSFAELIIVILVAVIFIKPSDLPEIAYFLGRMIFRVKKFIIDAKNYLITSEKELGFSELRQALNKGIADEKAKIKEEFTIIVDMYGNEHKVANVKEIRADLAEEEVDDEIKKLNEENLKKSKEAKAN